MGPRRILQLSSCAAAALVATVAIYALDAQRAGVQQTIAGLNWARQVSSQTEGMVYQAKERGEKDPVGWAVNTMSQGTEPRLVRVSRVHVENESAPGSETYAWDRAAGMFEYTRVLIPEDGTGVHIQLGLGYLGFLGCKSVATSDLLALAVFGALFALAFLASGRRFGFDDTQRIRSLVTTWVGGAKAQLTRHGIHIREMVRQSQRLAVSSRQSRDRVGELRARIHEGLSELHESRDFYGEGEKIAARAESLALNMAIEANRLGGDARRIADMASELHRQIQSLHAVNRKGQSLIQRLERKIEPWTTDADLAYHGFDEVKEATDLLGQHIRSTTESLLGQAKLIQGLNQELGARANDRAVVAPAPAPAPAAAVAVADTAAVAVAPAAAAEVLAPAPRAHQAEGAPQLPAPLPPIEERVPQPLFKRLRGRKSA